ncbi:CPBP family intramembrane glutamic endopeptidase [Fodinicola acaciae]|uniref:CPBP family intramembrane glutamic endopeptidase n=1 Tax=Fodinicola acaciae TaxID=2681555 RepID=UPI0013D7E777|nr:CPBP family intramembrane glutamic endopeptidase [Fodinicola acaciae]
MTNQKALIWITGLLLASGLPLQLGAVWTPATGVAAGIAATVILTILYAVVRTPALLIFAAISVFGWFSALVTSLIGDWLQTAPIPVAFLIVNALKLVSVVLAVVAARRLGWGRDDLNVHVGDLNAKVVGWLRWPVLGPLVILVVFGLFTIGVPWSNVAGWIPVFVLAAFVNAASEEFLYRHTAIRALRDTMSVPAAVVLTSLVFGLGHLTGNPGGWLGVTYTTAYGLICALAMVQTRGFGWNLTIHIFGDISIVLALTLMTPG